MLPEGGKPIIMVVLQGKAKLIQAWSVNLPASIQHPEYQSADPFRAL